MPGKKDSYDADSCPYRDQCQYIKSARKDEGHKTRISFVAMELFLAACLAVVMALVWEGG